MGSFINPIVQTEPTSPVLTVPGTVDTFTKLRITPKLRAGYFWANDRRHYLFARKGACYLSDISWHVFDLSDQPIPQSERVWVRGIEITGTTQYFFQGNKIWVNGGALTHPSTRWGVVEQDVRLTAYESRDMFIPGDEVKVDYNYYLWAAGTLSAGAGSFVNGADAGIDVTPDRTGTWADTWTITIPAATASPVSATLNLATKTITLTNWTTGTTTVQDAVDAFNALGASFTFAWDGVSSASDLLNTIVIALGGAPISETFSGGVDGGNTSTNIVEIQDLADSELLYKFEEAPTTGSPVVMTDDRMYHWDGRDIAPEFIVTEDGYVEFNPPYNYVTNPDFEGEPHSPIEWSSTGTVTIRMAGDIATDLYPRSGSHYVTVASGATISQTLPAFGTTENYISLALAGDTEVDVTLAFYDISWTLLTTDSWTTSGAAAASWGVFNRSYGPAGRERTYDFSPSADAIHAVLTLAPNTAAAIHVDYAFWGKTTLEPDHWQPHPLISVEFETDDSDAYYEHHPDISFDPNGDAITNLSPQDSVNLGAAENYEVTGFLYWKEGSKVDYCLGLGGTRTIPTSVENGQPVEWLVPGAGSDGSAITPDGEGGFFVGGAELYHMNKYGKEDFTISGNADIESLYFDVDNQLLYIGGSFTTIDSVSRNRLAAYDWRTREITSWNPASTVTVHHVGEGKGDTVVVAFAGTAATVGGSSRDCFAEINKGTNLVTSWTPASITGGEGRDIVYDPRNDIYIGAGTFTTAGSDNLRMWTSAGVLSSAFDPAVSSSVFGMDYNPETGEAYIAGAFATVYATARVSVAKVDVLGDALDAWNPILVGVAHSVVEAGDEVFMGGVFTTVGGLSRPRLAAVDNTIGTAVSEFRPNPDALVERLSYSEGRLGAVGLFANIGGRAHVYYTFFPVYNGDESKGRRHVPYCKVDGLGKLTHEGILRYNAQPWTREVTWSVDAPPVGEIRLADTQFIMQDNGNGFVTDPVAGDTVLDLTSSANDDHVEQEVERAFAVISDASNREVLRLKIFDGADFEALSAVQNTYSSASLDILYPLVKLYTTQDKYVRGKIVDANGAPMEGVVVEAFREDGITAYTIGAATDTTNQDGEFRFLVSGVSSATAVFMTIKAGALEKKFSITIETLP